VTCDRCRHTPCLCGWTRSVDLDFDRAADAHAAKRAPTLPPCASPESSLLRLRLLDEVSGRAPLRVEPDVIEDCE
jgi:hypothetical protein